jgi:hypothetical protein
MLSFGDSVRVFDGRAGWIASADRPMPLMPLSGGNLEGAKLEAMTLFQRCRLLIRLVRFVDTAVGRVPTQIDYSDYRDVGGVKLPFKWTATWTNGQSTAELSEIQINVPIEAAKFARPAPAPPPKE